MFKELDRNGVKMNLLANGATPYIYKNVFKEDLLLGMNTNQLNTESKDEELASKAGLNLVDIGIKLAYIMNAQAEKKRLSALSYDDFYKWLEQFEATTLYDDELMAEVYSVLHSDMETTSEAKN
jgi:hypothetical protein